MSHSHTTGGKFKPFSASFFVCIVTVSFIVYLSALWCIAPSIWSVQIRASVRDIVITTLAFHLGYAFFEFFFHRYVFHMSLIPGLSWLHTSHAHHHKLTNIVFREAGVINYFAIEQPEQHENSFFPWYSFLTFAAVLTPSFIGLQWLLPQAPIFLGGIIALVISISLYELLHALEHQPNELWDKRLTHSNVLIRMMWRRLYTFHLRHHANQSCNEGVGGFLGFRIADWFFGTIVYPRTIYPHGTFVPRLEFTPPKPCTFIAWLDEYAMRICQARRKKTV